MIGIGDWFPFWGVDIERPASAREAVLAPSKDASPAANSLAGLFVVSLQTADMATSISSGANRNEQVHGAKTGAGRNPFH